MFFPFHKLPKRLLEMPKLQGANGRLKKNESVTLTKKIQSVYRKLTRMHHYQGLKILQIKIVKRSFQRQPDGSISVRNFTKRCGKYDELFYGKR